MTDLEMMAGDKAIEDYKRWCVEKKLAEPDDIGWEVQFCQGECGKDSCDNNFITLSLGIEMDGNREIAKYQFEVTEEWDVGKMKRLWAKGFKAVESKSSRLIRPDEERQ